MISEFQHEINEFRAEYNILIDDLQGEIINPILAGAGVASTIDDAVIKIRFQARFESSVLNYAQESFINAGGPEMRVSAFRKFWLNKLWPADKTKLSTRTTRLSRMDELKETIKTDLKNQKSWLKIAKSLTDADLLKGDIAGHMQDLDRAARKVMQGDKSAIRQYNAVLKRSKREIERLSVTNASQGRLKKAYQKVIDATEKQSIESIEKAMKNAVRVKARYNGERIARTEIARAYSQGIYHEALKDSDVIGIRSELSSDHNIFDICDFHANANLYGMGKGAYPLSAMPPYPYHPHCKCILTKIFSGDTDTATKNDFNKKGATKYLDGLSIGKRKELLGVKGEKIYKRTKKTWQNSLKNWEGHKGINGLLDTNLKK